MKQQVCEAELKMLRSDPQSVTLFRRDFRIEPSGHFSDLLGLTGWGGGSVLTVEYCTMYLSVCLCFPPACLSLSCSGNTVKWRGCQGAVPTVPARSL